LQDKPDDKSVQIDELDFGNSDSERIRKFTEQTMASVGIGGATWFNDIRTGTVKLRIAQVPWYTSNREEHDRAVTQLQTIMASGRGSEKVSTSRKTKYASFEGFEHDERGGGMGIKYKDVIKTGKSSKSLFDDVVKKSKSDAVGESGLPQMEGLEDLKSGMIFAMIVDKNKMKKQ
jgi:hypothetical protein